MTRLGPREMTVGSEWAKDVQVPLGETRVTVFHCEESPPIKVKDDLGMDYIPFLARFQGESPAFPEYPRLLLQNIQWWWQR